MFDKEAIKEIQQSHATEVLSAAVRAAYVHPSATLFAHAEFTRHDLEKILPNRRRARGTMSTSDIASFAKYTLEHHEKGATVFVDAEAMCARSVLNLGDKEEPGHADNLVAIKLKPTAAYTALLNTAQGRQLSQQSAAEFLEDWAPEIECFGEAGGAKLAHGAAVAALRKLTIDTARKVESEDGQLSASLSVMEQVKASSTSTIPTLMYFTCVPYHGLDSRLFVLRLAVHTTADKPTLSLRVKNLEGAQEQMAQEFANKVRDAINEQIPVVIGTYAIKD